MATPRLTDLRAGKMLTPRAARCESCGDTGLVRIDGAPPARNWLEVPQEFLPCVCPTGDQQRRNFAAEGWL